MLLKVTLLSLGSAEAPLLDIAAYGGYAFAGLCLAGFAKIMWGYSYYALMPCTCLCTGVFLVKTMKRVLFAEVRSYDSSRHHYLLLFLALVQFPLLIWLGNISVNWLFWKVFFFFVFPINDFCCEFFLLVLRSRSLKILDIVLCGEENVILQHHCISLFLFTLLTLICYITIL